MRKSIFFILFGLLTLPALAQTASYVTMTGTNANYPNGILTANFVPPANSSQFDYLKYRFPFTVTGYLNGSGVWSMSLGDTSTVLPASSQWQLKLCSAATYGAATCYTVTMAITCVNNGSCSGTTLDLSSTFAAAPVPPSNPPATVASSETVAFSATPTFSTATRSSIITLTGNITSFTIAAGADGQEKTLIFCQDGTGGRTVAAPANVANLSLATVASTCSAQHLTYSVTKTEWIADSTTNTFPAATGVNIGAASFTYNTGNSHIVLNHTLDLGSNPAVMSGIFVNSTQTTVNGSTSGSAVFSQTDSGTGYKRVVIYVNALSGTASYTYSLAFTHIPIANFGGQSTPAPLANTIITSLSATAITLTGGGTVSGYIVLEGN
jgi:hypothetical protein